MFITEKVKEDLYLFLKFSCFLNFTSVLARHNTERDLLLLNKVSNNPWDLFK